VAVRILIATVAMLALACSAACSDEIDAAVLYATVAIVGTHAAVWNTVE
jgi:hypothetical protein